MGLNVTTIKIVDALTRRTLPSRSKKINSIILHTTGSPKRGETSEEYKDRILKFYGSKDGYQPHWFIDLNGTAYHTADENRIAYHCAIWPEEAELYRQGFDHWSKFEFPNRFRKSKPRPYNGLHKGFAQWRQQWPDLESPLDLPTKRYPNHVSIGIELQQPHSPWPEVIFGDAQYESCRQLVHLICERWEVECDRLHILGHQDCSPMRRHNDNTLGLTDPGWGFDFGRVIYG